MSEKEMNRAILAELYKAADETWKAVKTGSVEVGSYTAAKVARMIKSRELQLVDDRCYSVTVGDFTCSFTSYSVFAIVAKFETLAGVGSRRKLFTAKPLEEASEMVVRCKINKSMASLANFAQKSGPLRSVMKCVCIDTEKKLAYASDRHVLQFLHLSVCSDGGEKHGKNSRPLIPSADWKKMCLAAGDGAELKCHLRSKGVWTCECNGVVSGFHADVEYPNPVKVVDSVSAENLLALSGDTWKELRKELKDIKNKEAIVVFRHEERADNITVTVECPGGKTGKTTVFSHECAATPKGRYFFAAKVCRLVKVKKFLLYVPTTPPHKLQFHDEGGRLTIIAQTLKLGETAYSLPASNTFNPLDFLFTASKDTDEALEFINEESKEEAKAVAIPVAEQPQEENKTNPAIMKQWQELKDKHPEALLLIRIDDKYIICQQDAERGAQILNIPVVRDGTGNYSAYFPHRALDSYLPKLIKAGERVAICDQLRCPEAKNTAPAHVIEEVVPQCKAEQEPQELEEVAKSLDEAKGAKAEAPAKEVVSCKEAVKAAPSLDMDGKKFAFAKVGVNVGDTLTFIDGTKVAAADGNKVEYKGKLYTLSGYCKAFMPESKRNKANSYRGCEYFYNADGIKLGKLFKEYQMSVTAPLEVQNEEAAKGKIKAVKPLKRSERTITRPGKENATETKERGGVYSWLRRTLGRVHRIAAAFSL